MTLLETANNAARELLTDLGCLREWLRNPGQFTEGIRQLREYSKESWRRDESRKAGLARIADLEHNLEVAESSNANLTELVTRLESELATLRAKPEPPIPEPDPGEGFELIRRHDAIVALRDHTCCEYSVFDSDSNEWEEWSPISSCQFETNVAYAFRRPITKPESSIPEPEYGYGWELCGKKDATQAIVLLAGNRWGSWQPISRFSFDHQSNRYRFRRPIAKPEPHWVACTASEARYLVCESDDASNVERSENGDRWCDAERWDKFLVELAYRTTSTLPEWLELLPDDFDRVRRIDGVEVRIPMSTRAYEVRRATVPVGTMLG